MIIRLYTLNFIRIFEPKFVVNAVFKKETVSAFKNSTNKY